MGSMQNKKGKRGERELAAKLKDYGYDCRRAQQYCGTNGDADVIGLNGIHIECKRVERININQAMQQAQSNAPNCKFPVVFHRKNNCDWFVTMRLEDWIKIYREWDAGNVLLEG